MKIKSGDSHRSAQQLADDDELLNAQMQVDEARKQPAVQRKSSGALAPKFNQVSMVTTAPPQAATTPAKMAAKSVISNSGEAFDITMTENFLLVSQFPSVLECLCSGACRITAHVVVVVH